MTFIVCQQILVRLGPTILLISMNVAIIRNYNLSIQRKKKLRARKFVQRSSSQLFSREESVFTVETLDENIQTNREQRKASVQINPRKLAWPHFWRTPLHSPPNRDFCPRIGASLLFLWLDLGSLDHKLTKIGPNFRKQLLQKMKLSQNGFIINCSTNLIT